MRTRPARVVPLGASGDRSECGHDYGQDYGHTGKRWRLTAVNIQSGIADLSHGAPVGNVIGIVDLSPADDEGEGQGDGGDGSQETECKDRGRHKAGNRNVADWRSGHPNASQVAANDRPCLVPRYAETLYGLHSTPFFARIVHGATDSSG